MRERTAARPDPDPRLRRAWAALLALSFALVVALEYAHHRNRANRAAYNAARRADQLKLVAAVQQFRAEEDRDPALLGVVRPGGEGRLRPRRRDELEQALFPGRAPTTLPGAAPNGVRWHDPQRAIVFEFRFRPDGTWSSMSMAPPPTAGPPRPPWLLRAMRGIDPYRRMWVGSFTGLTLGPILWVALFAASFFRAGAAGRRGLAHAHLAVAWLCFLGWLINPNYTIRGLFSNDMLFWGALMLIASGFGFAFVSGRRREGDPTRCRACDYDLTGNVSGVCPECGTPTGGRSAAAAAAAAAAG